MQDHDSAGWDRFAAMDQPGLQFMNNTVDRLRTERGIAKSKVRDFLMKQLEVIIPKLAAEKDTDAAFDAEMAVCLPLLDQVVPDWRQLPAK